MDYRKELDRCSYTSEETLEYSKETFFIKDEVVDTLNNIETRVNNIKDILEPIQGLDEIDNVKDLLRSLSNDLY